LFEPFVQAESTLDRSSGGLGLGLALVKGLAELQGGEVRAHSEGRGQGSTFTIRLPLERRTKSRLAAVPTPIRTAPVRQVLVIEDNIDAAESLKDALELQNHVVEVALSGPDGVQKARSMRPDVVICDIGLPGMDGFEVARALRSNPDLANAALIALSGYSQTEDLRKATEAGFDFHLAKPASPEEIARVITEVHGRSARPTG
jgi:CheY-like chemotaxis protein